MTSTQQNHTFATTVEQHCSTKNLGENGMLQYSDQGVGSDLLVLNQLVRGGCGKAQVKAILGRENLEEVVDLCVLTFMTRNARGGKGEKQLAYANFLPILKQFPETGARLVPLFVHYGYWKDLFLLLEMGMSKLKPADHKVLRRAVLGTVA